MYRLLIENRSFRELYIPLRPVLRRELDKRIRKSAPVEPIMVWRNNILLDYEKYDLCMKYHRTYFCKDLYFRRKSDAIAWICREHLKRVDLCKPAIAWLISRLYEALREIENQKEAKDQFAYKILSPSYRSEEYTASPVENTDVMKQLAEEFHLHWRTVRYYVLFGRQLDELEALFPGTRIRVLRGELEISIRYMDILMNMPRKDLEEMVQNPECRKLIPPPELIREKERSRNSNGRKEIHVKTAIKETPAYDPDADLNGLSYTAGAWTKALKRASDNAVFQNATPEGKARLYDALCDLERETGKMISLLEVRENE